MYRCMLYLSLIGTTCPQGILDVGDLVSTSMNEELESAINLLDVKKYRQAKHILQLIHVAKRCKCGQYQHSDVMQYKPPTFTITLLVCKSLTVANLSLRGHCAKAVEYFLVCR